MKKCPQCEFIYEDEQSLCDMDGVLLVFDTRKLPNQNSLGTPAKAPAHPGRNRIIPMLAALVLATVLYLVYFVSTQQSASRTSYPAAGVSGSAPSAPNGPASGAGSLVAPPTNSPQSETAPTKDEKPTVPEKAVTSPESVGDETKSAGENVKETTPVPSPDAKPEEKKETKPKAQPTLTPGKSQSSVRAHSANESKITSFFKKTGRLLKKPFKN
jgi:outer membrane biosynthesis protein TonB